MGYPLNSACIGERSEEGGPFRGALRAGVAVVGRGRRLPFLALHERRSQRVGAMLTVRAAHGSDTILRHGVAVFVSLFC